MNDNKLEQLLAGWEDVYKKGQLTFWILLAVRDKPRHMKAMKDFVAKVTNGTFSVDDNSMYRALKRYEKAGLISHDLAPGNGGPERKVFSLTPLGGQLLKQFTDRNITGIYYDQVTKKIIKGEDSHDKRN